MKVSAGILVHRTGERGLEVLLAHPGGPLWAAKDEGAWSIPKGELDSAEDPERAARREFAEETGVSVEGELTALGRVRLKSGKEVYAWAWRRDLDAAVLASNTFTMEWPPRSGRRAEFPEIDRFAWFPLEEARAKVNPAQVAFIDRLEELIP